MQEPPSASFKGLKVIVCIVIPLHCGVCNVYIHAVLAKEMLAVVSREACTQAFIPAASWSSNSMESMCGEQNTNSYVNEDYSEEWRDGSPAAHPLTATGGFSLTAAKYPTTVKFYQTFFTIHFRGFIAGLENLHRDKPFSHASSKCRNGCYLFVKAPEMELLKQCKYTYENLPI